MTAAVELLLGGGMGLFLGLFGGGGSIVAVPIFVYLLGYGVKEAVAMSLVVVGLTSAIGAARAWRAGDVRPRAALLLGSVAMLGAYAGARAAAFLAEAAQLGLFAAVVLVSAAAMLRRRSSCAIPSTHGAAGGPTPPAARRTAAVGIAVGILTGLVGVGGGFLVVPALMLLGLPMSGAVATSLVVITMNAVAGLAGYLGQVAFPWPTLGIVTGASVVGLLSGGRLAYLIPQPARQRVFVGFLLVVGMFVLYQNRGALVHRPVDAAADPVLVAPAAH